jgi:hypothetical protein
MAAVGKRARRLHGQQSGDVGVREDADLYRKLSTYMVGYRTERTLRAFMFLKSMPTSAVTPEPKRRFEAAT